MRKNYTLPIVDKILNSILKRYQPAKASKGVQVQNQPNLTRKQLHTYELILSELFRKCNDDTLDNCSVIQLKTATINRYLHTNTPAKDVASLIEAIRSERITLREKHTTRKGKIYYTTPLSNVSIINDYIVTSKTATFYFSSKLVEYWYKQWHGKNLQLREVTTAFADSDRFSKENYLTQLSAVQGMDKVSKKTAVKKIKVETAIKSLGVPVYKKPNGSTLTKKAVLDTINTINQFKGKRLNNGKNRLIGARFLSSKTHTPNPQRQKSEFWLNEFIEFVFAVSDTLGLPEIPKLDILQSLENYADSLILYYSDNVPIKSPKKPRKDATTNAKRA